jgi:hypothetical protein
VVEVLVQVLVALRLVEVALPVAAMVVLAPQPEPQHLVLNPQAVAVEHLLVHRALVALAA